MHQIKIEIADQGKNKKYDFEIASCWNEINPEAYPFLASVYLNPSNKELKTAGAFALLTSKYHKVIKNLSHEDVYSMLPAIDFVFDTLDLTENLIPSFEINKKVFYGPTAELANISFVEWCFADTYFERYTTLSQTDEKTATRFVDKLVAVLYRPKSENSNPDSVDFNGDIRERFNENLLERRADQIASIPQHIKNGILLWFMSCRFKLVTDHPNVFPEPDEKKAERSDEPNFGWMGVFDELTGDKFGNQDELAKTNLFTVLFSMERNQIKFKKYKDSQ